MIDPRRTETAQIADEYLGIRPGTDVYLLLALLHSVFVRVDAVKLHHPAPLVDGLEVLREAALGRSNREIGERLFISEETVKTHIAHILYKLALPRKLPWHRGLPGAVLAMLVFLLSSIGLRLYISLITKTGYTYGALATPIAFLLFAFLIGFAIILGAYLNNAIEEIWPSRPTRRQRRLHRLDVMRRLTDRLRTEPDAPVPDPVPTLPEPTFAAPQLNELISISFLCLSSIASPSMPSSLRKKSARASTKV